MRRVHLRGHPNIRKRLPVHLAACNLGLLLRRVIGFGTPRCLQGRAATSRPVQTIARPVAPSRTFLHAAGADFVADAIFTVPQEHPLIHLNLRTSASGR